MKVDIREIQSYCDEEFPKGMIIQSIGDHHLRASIPGNPEHYLTVINFFSEHDDAYQSTLRCLYEDLQRTYNPDTLAPEV